MVIYNIKNYLYKVSSYDLISFMFRLSDIVISSLVLFKNDVKSRRFPVLPICHVNGLSELICLKTKYYFTYFLLITF